MRRTIVILESAAAMAGVQFSTLYLAQSLDRSQWDPIVVCPAEGDLTRACRKSGVETTVLAFPRFWSTSVRIGRNTRLPNPFAWVWNALAMLVAVRRLRLFLKQSAPDVLVTKGLQSHFIGGLATRRVGVPCVWHVQDLISERSLGIYSAVFKFAANRLPQHIIVDGAAIKEQLAPAIHSRVSIVLNGVDTSIFRPDLDGSAVRREFRLAPEQTVIGHAGRITPWKGQHYLIEAFRQVADKHPETVLLLVGSPVFDHDGYERRLKSMVAEFGLTERVMFAGYRHDLPDVLAAMDVFAFTSIEKETSPLALISAMASGLPVVAFDIQGVRELDDTGTTFALARVGDADALARSLSLVLGDNSRRAQLQRHARAVAEKFSLSHYIASIEHVLMSACAGAEERGGTIAASIDSDRTREQTEPRGAGAVSTAALNNG